MYLREGFDVGLGVKILQLDVGPIIHLGGLVVEVFDELRKFFLAAQFGV